VDRGVYLSRPDDPLTGQGVEPNVYLDPKLSEEQVIEQAVKAMQ
jgi:hypothetical protein